MAVLDANDQNFDEVIRGEYAIVDFYGDNCGACQMFAPIFESASNETPYIKFIHINVSHNPEIAKRYGIEFIPTVYYYRNGESVFKTSGAADSQELDRRIAKLLYE